MQKRHICKEPCSHTSKVGMQKVNLTPTVNIVNGEKVTTPNAPVYIYDTSGPFSDPNMEIDLKRTSPYARSWIIGRGDVENCPPLPQNTERCAVTIKVWTTCALNTSPALSCQSRKGHHTNGIRQSRHSYTGNGIC